jgi:hypothetical protein
MTHLKPALALLGVLVSLVLAIGVRASAEEPAAVAYCEAIPSSGMTEAASMRSKWMNEQIAEGRNRFMSDVAGIICAW